MTIGSIGNAATVYQIIRNGKWDLTTRQRLVLLLLAETCASGVGLVWPSRYVAWCAAPDETAIHSDLLHLAKLKLIRMTDTYAGQIWVSLCIASDEEIADAWRGIGEPLPFLTEAEIDAGIAHL